MFAAVSTPLPCGPPINQLKSKVIPKLLQLNIKNDMIRFAEFYAGRD
jgi:hypothetical protein